MAGANIAGKTFQNMQRCLQFMAQGKGFNSCMKHVRVRKVYIFDKQSYWLIAVHIILAYSTLHRA